MLPSREQLVATAAIERAELLRVERDDLRFALDAIHSLVLVLEEPADARLVNIRRIAFHALEGTVVSR